MTVGVKIEYRGLKEVVSRLQKMDKEISNDLEAMAYMGAKDVYDYASERMANSPRTGKIHTQWGMTNPSALYGSGQFPAVQTGALWSSFRLGQQRKRRNSVRGWFSAGAGLGRRYAFWLETGWKHHLIPVERGQHRQFPFLKPSLLKVWDDKVILRTVVYYVDKAVSKAIPRSMRR